MNAKHHRVAISAFILVFLAIAGCSTRSDSSKPDVFVAAYHGDIAAREIVRLLQENGLTNWTTVAGSYTGRVVAERSDAAKARSVITKAIKQDGLDAVIININN